MKTATVSARIEEDVKAKAEDILQQLGLPVSVVINSLYRQIIAVNGIPFPMTLSSEPSDGQAVDGLDLSDPELNERLERGYQQVMKRKGRTLDEVFGDLERKYAP